MDIRKIRRLIQLLEGSDINEIEISEGEDSVRISRGTPAPPPAAQPPAQPAAPPAPAADSGTGQEAAEEEEGVLVTSPMVGTFYRAPTPESEPFVREGDRVSSGDTVCIIEAMKLFNEIEAECSGVVKRILAENAQPVEYGEGLLLIDPDG
jgi:acetyl-CoA carboxylase biotin carboxyl carrier protein